jgi:endonuclease-3
MTKKPRTAVDPKAKISAANPIRSAQMRQADVRPFLEALAAAHPNPQSDLEFADPYTLLVAVTLSAQTTDAAVNKATRGLFAAAPTPEAMVALGVEEVGKHIRTIGLWQGKARNVVALSALLIELHGGQVPHDRAALEALPGVGRKTANVVLNVRRKCDGGGHAYLPPRQPHRPRPRQERARSGGQAHAPYSRRHAT